MGLKVKSIIDIEIMVLASLLLFLAMFTGKRRSLDRWEGGLFLVIYIGYLAFLIHRG
jgi:cation:H+ antiporter